MTSIPLTANLEGNGYSYIGQPPESHNPWLQHSPLPISHSQKFSIRDIIFVAQRTAIALELAKNCKCHHHYVSC